MRDKEITGLYQAYLDVYSNSNEEVEQLDEDVQGAVKGALEKGADIMKTNPVLKAVGSIIAPANPGRKTPTATSGGYRPVVKSTVGEETDPFDAILEHLVAEGYADTNESALAIMANMSEEWRESIVEGNQRNPERDENTPKRDEAIPGQAARKMPKRGHPDREAFEKWYRANVR